MKVLWLWCFLFFSESTGLEGEWELKYRTFGKKVVKKISVNRLGDRLIAKSSEEEFCISFVQNTLGWELEVPTINGLATARFKGILTSENEMSGVLIISEVPLNGRAIVWKAFRKNAKTSDPEEDKAKKPKM